MEYALVAQTFFGVLAVVVGLGAVGLVGLAMAGRRVAGARRLLDQLRPSLLGMAAVVAGVTTLGSLYFSEVVGYEPCKLCWLQRAFMYPLAVIVPIAAARRDVAVRVYVVPLALIGGAVSVHHHVLERWPQSVETSCSTAVPCTSAYFWSFGQFTLAAMAAVAFAFLAVATFLAGAGGRREPAEA